MEGEETRASLLDRQLGGIDLRNLAWLLLMSTTLFVMLFPFSSYVAALPIIQDEWGLNNTQAGAIFSAYLAGFAVSALVVVPLTDRLGSKRIFVFSTVVSVAANVLFPIVAHDAITASALRAVAGLGLVGVYNPGMRIVAERFANRGRGFAVGTFVTFFYASNSVSLTLTGILMSQFEWRDAYLIMGGSVEWECVTSILAATQSQIADKYAVFRSAGPFGFEESGCAHLHHGVFPPRSGAIHRARVAACLAGRGNDSSRRG